MKLNQKGFGAVETLLVLILLSILGFTGYYVYHTRNNTNSSYNNAANVSSNSPSSTMSTKFVFKELGVQINLPDTLKGLYYTINKESGQTSLDLATPEYDKAMHKCDPSTAGNVGNTFSVITKMPGQYDENKYPITTNLKQFNDFWVSAASPNGIVCADSASQQDKDNFSSVFSQSRNSLREAFKTAEVVQ